MFPYLSPYVPALSPADALVNTGNSCADKKGRRAMCHTVGRTTIVCAAHTEAAYVFALHTYRAHRYTPQRLHHLGIVASDFACTIEGQARIAADMKDEQRTGDAMSFDVLGIAVKFGRAHLAHQHQALDSAVTGMHREITRMWATVVPTSDTALDIYLNTVAKETGLSVQELRHIASTDASLGDVITPTDKHAVRFITEVNGTSVGTPKDTATLTCLHRLELLSARHRLHTRRTVELADPDGGVWQEYHLPPRAHATYNEQTHTLLLPDLDTDLPARTYTQVTPLLAAAVASARRPGLLVAAAFFPATDGSLHHHTVEDFAFAATIANDLFPLSAEVTGPAPERILPEPIRRTLQRGLPQ